MTKKASNVSSFTIFSVLVVILIGIYSFGIWKINDYQKKTDLLEGEVQTNTNLIKNLKNKSGENKIEEEGTDLSKLDTFFIREGQEFTLIQKVEDICRATGVICDIKPIGIEVDPALPSQYHLLHLVINVKGSFKDIYQFATVIENMQYRLDIFRVDLKWSGDVWSGEFDFSVTTMP